MLLYPFRFFALLVFASLLSSCTIESIADKLLPEDIKQESAQIVDAIMESDTQFFIQRKADLLPPDQLETTSDAEFAASIGGAFSTSSISTEISRHIVGVKTNVSASLGEGMIKTYEMVYELETSEGFVLISLRLANRSETNDCCEIKLINIHDYKTSPIRAGLALTKKVFIVLGVSVLGLFVIFGAVFIRRRRRKKTVSNT